MRDERPRREGLSGGSPTPERYEPLPSVLELPAFLIARTPAWAKIVIALTALSAVIGAVILIPKINDDKRARSRADQRAAAIARRAAAAALTLDQRPRDLLLRRTGGPPDTALGLLERGITRDARQRFAQHLVSGPPVRTTSCSPSAEQSRSPAVRRYQRQYDCFAQTAPGLGFDFTAVIDRRHRTATWCKANLRSSSRNDAAVAPLSRRCFVTNPPADPTAPPG